MLDELFSLESSKYDSRIWCCSWSKETSSNFEAGITYLASSGEDKSIRIWRINSNANSNANINANDIDNNKNDNNNINIKSNNNFCSNIAILEDGQSRTIRCIDWSSNNNMIASASFDGTVVIWQNNNSYSNSNNNYESWDMIASLEGHENEVKCVMWSSNDRYLATCGRDKKIWIWEQINDDYNNNMNENTEFECVTMLEGHSQDVKSLVWHTNEELLFSASYDDTIRIWAIDSIYNNDGDDWYNTDVLNGHTSTVWSLSLDSDYNRLVSSSDDLSIRIWQCTNNNNIKQEGSWYCINIINNVHKYPIYSIALNFDGNYIASCGGDNNIIIHEINGGQIIENLIVNKLCEIDNAHNGDVNCVRWKNNLIASCGDDGLIKIWEFSL